ncbi:MAG: hypothetical protein EXS37_11370 [Opitutus sp.]|nr:hypothetical protein [Opitutus sp.]
MVKSARPTVARPNLSVGGYSVFPVEPRLKTLVLINGRLDFTLIKPSQGQMFRFLGTPPEHKRHVFFDTGHTLRPDGFAKDVLDWLDCYLGRAR